MPSLAARLQAECGDNLGATPAREAAEALKAVAEDIEALTGAESPVIAAALIRLRQAVVTAEKLFERQISAALMREAGYAEGYAAGRAARGLSLVR